MAFVVEDGSGLSTATAYISVAYATMHHDDRNNTAWIDYSTAEKEAGIVRATDYVDKRFGRRFRGFRKLKSQALEWPRFNAFDNDGYLLSSDDEVPRQLQKAIAEYALRALLIGVLAPDPSLNVPSQSLESGLTDRETEVVSGLVERKREKVSSLEEETWYVTDNQTVARRIAAGERNVQSSLINDFHIPEYPEADLWIEELIKSGSNFRLIRG